MNESFDSYAENYDDALKKGISVSGENKDYFAQGRIAWLARCLKKINVQPQTVMDYGCGTGSATPFFLNTLSAKTVIGVDISEKSIELARKAHGSGQTQFMSFDEFKPAGQVDLVFCNGVFHHIPLNQRAAAIDYIYRALKPGGFFSLWENNPWNPGARLVMHRIPFDRDAIMVSAPEAKRLLRSGKFEIARTDFNFIFPHSLRFLRGLEAPLSRLPFGAQYQVLARK